MANMSKRQLRKYARIQAEEQAKQQKNLSKKNYRQANWLQEQQEKRSEEPKKGWWAQAKEDEERRRYEKQQQRIHRRNYNHSYNSPPPPLNPPYTNQPQENPAPSFTTEAGGSYLPPETTQLLPIQKIITREMVASSQ